MSPTMNVKSGSSKGTHTPSLFDVSDNMRLNENDLTCQNFSKRLKVGKLKKQLSKQL